MDNEIKQVVQAIWIILPAYVANGAPVVAVKVMNMLGLKRHPIDRGMIFVDGRRIFGDSKTWEGFAIGVCSGILTSAIQMVLEHPGTLYITYIGRGIALSLGAMVGDLLGSFIKRRLGLKSGDPLPVLDQTSFLFVALAIALPLKLIDITLSQLVYLVVVTVILHVATNYLAYKLGLKNVPW